MSDRRKTVLLSGTSCTKRSFFHLASASWEHRHKALKVVDLWTIQTFYQCDLPTSVCGSPNLRRVCLLNSMCQIESDGKTLPVLTWLVNQSQLLLKLIVEFACDAVPVSKSHGTSNRQQVLWSCWAVVVATSTYLVERTSSRGPHQFTVGLLFGYRSVFGCWLFLCLMLTVDYFLFLVVYSLFVCSSASGSIAVCPGLRGGAGW